MKVKRMICFTLALVTLTAFCIPAFAVTDISLPSEQEVRLLSDQRLLEEAEDAYIHGDDSLYVYASEIGARDELSSAESVAEVLVAPNEDLAYKTMLLEVYLSENDFTILDEELVNALNSSTVENSLKILILAGIEDSLPGGDYDSLVDLSNNPNGTIAFHALKALGRVSAEQALPIANSILDNYSSETPDRISAAVTVAALQEREATMRTAGEEPVIEMLSEIFVNVEDEDVRNSVILALKEIGSQEAILEAMDLMASVPAVTAVDQIGYAAFRDGVDIALGYQNWHAAIIVSRVGNSQSYAQATGLGATTERVTYNEFLENGSPKGYYRPKSTSITSDQRSYVAQTAEDLASLKIPYVTLSCISYYSVPSSRLSYKPTDIKYVRCDGFVEYCFEYNNIRVCGPTSGRLWDISSTSAEAQDCHFGVAAITPKSQAQTYMVKVGELS